MVYNTVRLSDLPRSDRASCRQHLGLSGFVFCFVGALRGVYALDEFIESAHRFRNESIPATFIIVGGGDEAARLESKARDFGLGEYVRFIPQVPNQLALEYLKSSDVSFAVNSHLDENVVNTLPWKIFEAMACGTPVVVSENTQAWAFVNSIGFGFSVHSADSSTIYQKLRWAFDHPDLLFQMSYKAKIAYEQSYSWETTSKELTATYAALIRGSR